MPAERCRSLRSRMRNSAASRSAAASCREMAPSSVRSSNDDSPQQTRPSQRTSWMSRSPPGDRFTFGSRSDTVWPNLPLSSRRAAMSRSASHRGERRASDRSRAASLSSRSALPASGRQSSSELKIVASAAARRQASPTVRTLWPTSRPASKRSCSSRLATAATRPGARASWRIIRSTSDHGAISRRPNPPWATSAACLPIARASSAGRSARIAPQTPSTIPSKRSEARLQVCTPGPPAACCAAILARRAATPAAARATAG